MFDEISLCPGLAYNPSKDCIDGLVDFGGPERRAIFADHALVFMLKGIRKKWKQPISFYFSESATPTVDLVRIIKDVVRHVRQTGLKVIATVCDQGTTNVAAINYLKNDTNAYCVRNGIENRYNGYLVDELEVIHIYDCPHLMKGVRNGLLTKNLNFVQNGQQKVASWSHVINIYQADCRRGIFSEFSKLTDEHVMPDKIRKMKVKNCTQVFSRSVALNMRFKAEVSKELSKDSIFYLDPSATDTADLLLFFDQLFDSVNGSSLVSPAGKELRRVVTIKSKHLETWKNAIVILKSMFYSSGQSQKIITPSLKNWQHTINSFIYIWQILRNNGFSYFSPRSFNQDPVENFFSLIRSHNVTNANPTCSAFISSVKTLIINNFMSSHSLGSNCENDESSGLLDTFREFIHIKQGPFKPPNIKTPVYPNKHFTNRETDIDLATPYVAGVVIKKLYKKHSCDDCASILQSKEDLPENILIRKRQYSKGSLISPSATFINSFKLISENVYSMMPSIINSYGIKKSLKSNINETNFNSLFCKDHSAMVSKFVSISINICLFHYIKTVNNILSGKDIRYKNLDILTNLAFSKYEKRRKGKH